MEKIITEINIVPIIPEKGLVAFVNFVLFEKIYCSSIGVFTRPNGGYRLLYPTKKVANRNLSIFYPINKGIGVQIENEVIKKFKEVTNNDRHCCNNTTAK